MSSSAAIAIASLLLLIILYSMYTNTHVYVKSTVDGNEYYVRDLPDKLDASNTLALVKRKLDNLIDKLVDKYDDSDDRVNRLKNIFANTQISESRPLKGITSYTINKRNMILCVRMRDENKIIDTNTILFVALHELAHIATVSVGHTDAFWSNFRWLLAHAVDFGIYEYVDYEKHKQRYCGIFITDQPFKLIELENQLKKVS